MPRRLPDGAELKFIRTQASGTVHVLINEPERAGDETPAVSIGAGLAAWATGSRPVTVLCGRDTYPVVTNRHDPVGEFADDDLCHACYRALAPADRWRLFEHPQPATA